MRASFTFGLVAALLVATPLLAKSPLIVTTVTAGPPDPNGKVPAFNAVPGSGVFNYSIAAPQAELFHGSVYTYCVSMQDLGFKGSGVFSYAIKHGSASVQSATIGTIANLNGNGIYALCLNGAALPDVAGPATITGSVAITNKGKPFTALQTVKLFIK